MDCEGRSEGGWYTFSPTVFVPILKSLWMQNAAAKRVGGWSRTDVILELGGILKAREAVGGRSPFSQAPAAHQLFSKMSFVRGGDNMRLSQLDEGDTGAAAQPLDEGYDDDECSRTKEERGGGWLVEDDIQDFD